MVVFLRSSEGSALSELLRIIILILSHSFQKQETNLFELCLGENRWSSEGNANLFAHCRVATEEDKVKRSNENQLIDTNHIRVRLVNDLFL